ncbi:nose resistant to fluoxetine protein 6-like [Acanthaster planci]|uniref:Nose resistant to fluoxetine protein 6-like n=1 Tax=Acanthaster planci TaxID=133434 RepID=A0A8B7YQ36_ACAPL|nr:nose resistant to fluoxetine protein 6-like [Acanthaster planci]
MATSTARFVFISVLLLTICCAISFAHLEVDPSKLKNILYKSWSPPLHEATVDTYNVSAACEAEIKRLIGGDPRTLESDVIMALDAFGKPPAGLLQLNFGWYGHYDECMAIEGFNYCLTDLMLNVTKLSEHPKNSSLGTGFPGMETMDIKWGICVPKNCSDEDVDAVITHLLDALQVLESVNIPRDVLQETGVVCAKNPTIPYSAGVICTIILCGFIGALMILGALYDEFLKLQAKKSIHHRLREGMRQPWRLLDETDEADVADDDVPLLKDVGTGNSINRESPSPKTQSLAARLLLCFALNRNVAKLMDTKQSDASVGCLNGVRVISMSWVILGHTVAFSVLNPIDNLPTFYHWISTHPGFQAVANAFFSVDSFFFLSGFLVAYLTFARFRELRTIKTWALFYFHRYWRLTPLFAFTILIWMYIPQYFGYGPAWQSSAFREFCPQYWWSSLLYISNFWPKAFGEECIAWTWYLANDMQFFAISPLLMAPLFYFPLFGWLALIATLLASFISTGLIIGLYDLQVSLAGLESGPPDANFSSLVYGKPYCRIAPYLVGIGLGYIMHRIGKRRVKMSPVLAVLGWLVAAGMALSVLYGLYPSFHTPMTKAANIVYGSISRFVWALALAWLVFACKYGYGGWINSFLSWSVWVPLARVTFSAYMFHPIVIEVFYGNFASPFHFSVYLMAFYFAGLVSVSYFVAILVALAIEYPFANLEKVLLPTPARTKKVEGLDGRATMAGDREVVTVVTGRPVENGLTQRVSAYQKGLADSRGV